MKKNKKIIIFYNNDLRSKIVYTKVIIDKCKHIECIVQVPSLSNTRLKKKFIFQYFVNLPFELKIYYLVNYFFFPIISLILSNKLSDIAKTKKVKFYKYSFPVNPIIFCKQKKINLSNKVIIYGTPNIIKLNNHKYNILNIHDADAEKYRGIFSLHKMMLNKDINLKTSLLKISKKIDKGDILYKSREYKMNKFCFFKYTIVSWVLNCENIIKLINNINKNFKYKKNLNNEYTGLDLSFLKKLKKKKYKLCLEGLYDFIILCFKKNLNYFYKFVNKG